MLLALVLVPVPGLALALALALPHPLSSSLPQLLEQVLGLLVLLLLFLTPTLPDRLCAAAQLFRAPSEPLHAATSAAMSSGSLSTVELAHAVEQNSPWTSCVIEPPQMTQPTSPSLGCSATHAATWSRDHSAYSVSATTGETPGGGGGERDASRGSGGGGGGGMTMSSSSTTLGSMGRPASCSQLAPRGGGVGA
jgi:hypothetical protein